MDKSVKISKPGSLKAWLDYLQELNPEHMELGLERIKCVFERLHLGALQKLSVIEVAGTNGKGSTAALIAASLRLSGIKCGLYTSPHLHRFNERVCIDGEEASDEALCRAFSLVYDAACQEPLIKLTYFEYTTLAAFLCFADAKVQVLVLEIGLGGRLDAVNVLDAEIAIITSIGFDHTRILGNTLEKIAFEKAGIIKSGAQVICGILPKEAMQSISLRCKDMQAKLYEQGRDFVTTIGQNVTFTQREPAGDDAVSWTFPLPKIPYECVGVALQALCLLKNRGLDISYDKVTQAIATTVLKGRMQKVHSSPEVFFDVAHNLPAAKHLVTSLSAHIVEGRRLCVIGMLADKDIEGVLHTLAGFFDAFYVASLHTGRGEGKERLVAALLTSKYPSSAVKSYENVKDAFKACFDEASPDDEITVCGSFVTVTEASDCALEIFGQGK